MSSNDAAFPRENEGVPFSFCGGLIATRAFKERDHHMSESSGKRGMKRCAVKHREAPPASGFPFAARGEGAGIFS